MLLSIIIKNIIILFIFEFTMPEITTPKFFVSENSNALLFGLSHFCAAQRNKEAYVCDNQGDLLRFHFLTPTTSLSDSTVEIMSSVDELEE